MAQKNIYRVTFWDDTKPDAFLSASNSPEAKRQLTDSLYDSSPRRLYRVYKDGREKEVKFTANEALRLFAK